MAKRTNETSTTAAISVETRRKIRIMAEIDNVTVEHCLASLVDSAFGYLGLKLNGQETQQSQRRRENTDASGDGSVFQE